MKNDTFVPVRPRAIIGLGNPGEKYQKTRHNAGFRVIAELAGRLRCRLKAGKGHYQSARRDYRGELLILAAPTTYMNDSGIGVLDLAERERLAPEELLVVLDDFALPLGTIRLRPAGSDGGHNGLASVLYHIGSDSVPRLRIGVGPLPEGASSVDFVLGEFSDDEEKKLADVVQKAADAVLYAVWRGIAKAASIYNRRTETKENVVEEVSKEER